MKVRLPREKIASDVPLPCKGSMFLRIFVSYGGIRKRVLIKFMVCQLSVPPQNRPQPPANQEQRRAIVVPLLNFHRCN